MTEGHDYRGIVRIRPADEGTRLASMTNAEMGRIMAAEIAGNAPAGEDDSLWRYD